MTIRQSRVVDPRSGEFQRRYDPGFAWKSAAAVLLGIPGLRAAWTMGDFNEAGNAYDISGQARTLSYQGNPTYNYRDLVPYLDMDGAGDYLSRADEAGIDILGTESYVAAAVRGLTMGLWFRPDRLTNAEFLIGKATGVAATSSYWLAFRGDQANDPVNFSVSDGAANTAASLASAVGVAGTWYFAAARFDPGTEIKVWMGSGGVLQSNTNAVAIPAALNNSGSQLTIGATSAGAAWPLDGGVSMGWLSCMFLSDTIVASVFEQTRAMFGQ